MKELTPFSDGEGYLEYGWGALTPAQARVLAAATERESGHAQGGISTLRALVRYGLIDDQHYVTNRGRELIEWADRTGLLP